MQSRRCGAMARFGGAGWPRGGSRVAIPGAVRAPIRYLEEFSPVNEQRNIILAVVLSALVLIGWTFISERWIPTANPPATKTVNGKQVPVPRPQASPSANTPAVTHDRATMLRETPRIAVDTPRLHGSISLKGARVDDLVLTQHRESIAANSPPIRLLSPAGAPDAYFASFGWTGEGIALPGPDTVWTASGNHLTPGSPVTLSWTNPQGLRFDIAFAIDDSYLFTVEQRVSNATAGDIKVRPWALVSRAGESHDKSSYTMHIGPVGVFDGAANYSWTYKDLVEKGDQRLASNGGWIGFTDKYWLTAPLPDQRGYVGASFR